MIFLPITLTITGAVALLHVWLSLRVSLLRRRMKIAVGDAGNEAMTRRMRAHANFAENAPIMLILLGLIELATGGSLWLWAAAIVFVMARIAHAFGMDRGGANPLRVGGIVLSWLVVLGLGIYAIVLGYRQPLLHNEMQLSPGRAASVDPAAPGI